LLIPPIDSLSETEIEPVVEILRASTDLGDANRTLRQQYPQWTEAGRLAALRQAQGVILDAWGKSPARKRREVLRRSHAGVPHEKEE
jgi:hypothetical protein